MGFWDLIMARTKKSKESFLNAWRKEHDDFFKTDAENQKYWKSLGPEKINPIKKKKRGKK